MCDWFVIRDYVGWFVNLGRNRRSFLEALIALARVAIAGLFWLPRPAPMFPFPIEGGGSKTQLSP